VLEEIEYQPLIETMARLNKYVVEAVEGLEVHALTDVTGYSFSGHLREMMAGSKTTAVIDTDSIPLLGNVLKYAKLKQVPGGSKRNKDFLEDFVRIDENIGKFMIDVMFDAQTSGGLIVSVPADQADNALEAIRKNGDERAEIVGKVVEAENVDVILL